MNGKYTIEARKQLILHREFVGALIYELPYFVDGMSDYDLEQEEARYNAYCLEHGSDEGFEPMKITK